MSDAGKRLLDSLWFDLWADLRLNATGKPSGDAIIERHRPAIEAEAVARIRAAVKAGDPPDGVIFIHDGQSWPGASWSSSGQGAAPQAALKVPATGGLPHGVSSSMMARTARRCHGRMYPRLP